MAERGNTKHGPNLDDQMKHEAQGVVHGIQPPHAEEWRETEPFPDDTDPAEVQEALNPVASPDSISDEEDEQ
ncbi:hypothetical protein [Arthrobacter sp. Alg241-R88]|jgi:hypothetical protein|uniref:hypothetical protein n=1 Tax=Micrococcaceae TaxID=1268 RepID=UPI0013D3C17A|nr:hypothetical protein [Arthrobacter sp. Alg241-R88]